MDEIMEQLVKFVMETTFDDLPEELVHETKRTLLDCLGCGVGGLRTKRGRISTQMAQRMGGTPESTILGTAGKVSCVHAAFANGELINALDYDTTFSNHIPPYVIPAPLAVGETVSAPGKDLILSVALGQEVARRIRLAATGPYWPKPDEPDRGKIIYGYVSGNSSSVFGATVGAGKMLNLSPEKMASAMGIAAYAGPPSTYSKWMRTVPGRMTKYGPPGFSAEVGVQSALLADMGYYGDTDVFEGEYGYWRFSGYQEWNKDKVVADLGKKWVCLKVGYKKYPAGM
jgi:2-methylcitrate dehydratase PrpD